MLLAELSSLQAKSPALRVMAILEAHSVTGPAKAILEFHREAAISTTTPRIELSILTFRRGHEENHFTRTIRAEGIPLDIVQEKGRFDLGVVRQLREAIRRRHVDIIWTNAVKSHFLIRAAGLHKMATWVAFHHGYTTTHWTTRCYNVLDRWSHRGARRLVTVCGPFADLLASRGVARERLRVEHMPIRPSDFQFRKNEANALRDELGIDPNASVLLSVGRLSKEKGHAELIRALASISADIPLRLLLAGDGPEHANLSALAAALGVKDRVIFLGHQTDVNRYYRIADLFVLPSHSEGSPNVLLEALDAGVPVVATAVGGIPEMVSHEKNALLVPKMNVQALADAITRILQDEPLRRRLTEAGKSVLERHSPRQYFENIAAIFREAAAEGR